MLKNLLLPIILCIFTLPFHSNAQRLLQSSGDTIVTIYVIAYDTTATKTICISPYSLQDIERYLKLFFEASINSEIIPPDPCDPEEQTQNQNSSTGHGENGENSDRECKPRIKTHKT